MRRINAIVASCWIYFTTSSSELAAGELSAGLKRTVHEAHHSPATTAEFQSDESSTITLTSGRERTVPSDSSYCSTPHVATRLLSGDSERLLHWLYVS